MWRGHLRLAGGLSVLTSLLMFSQPAGSSPVCLASSEGPGYVMTGTKTGYSVVENTEDSPLTGHPLHHSRCGQYDFMWLLARHGTRFPSALAIRQISRQLPKIRDQIVANHRAGRGQMCQEDVERLERWELYLSQQDDSLLTETGAQEMEGLGAR